MDTNDSNGKMNGEKKILKSEHRRNLKGQSKNELVKINIELMMQLGKQEQRIKEVSVYTKRFYVS